MISPAATIHGTVRDPSGRPVADAAVYYRAAPVPMPDIAAMTNDDGTFSLHAPGPGAYRIGCTAEGFLPSTLDAHVAPGQRSVEVDIRLTK